MVQILFSMCDYPIHLKHKTLLGKPMGLMSNFKLGSILLDALCILKENCQPLLKHKTILLHPSKSQYKILFGKFKSGIFIILFLLGEFLLRLLSKLKVCI